ncbi:30S ribosome-binding factor RbfA [Desulfobulbus oligotrophicus]|jgi:ribosome-binding factor A|uniref:Ribosome-binding factor A n=1 Tax=Desulfobulbus oligotrophicus TaxID=1909699 RepID=A0A7T5VCR7_9BACT|nr:30S ribosome-binding factor RbfA [Desulfobulbus oligotrophicus]MDY0389669.1 30S ribosome-binding factor RbfA [Desulfobulbus oligotrophicus]QQG65500.1 30S ribosome-binding factor RbfA [Desulfobulbus oligotrophicus]
MAVDFDFKLPGLGRPESSRPKRVAEAIKNELTILLLQKVADPRLNGVRLSRVIVTPDLKSARVYFTTPSNLDSGVALKGMNRAKGYFRSHLARVLNLRYTPELLFYYDNLNEEIDRIDGLFRQIEKERKHEQS